MQSGFQELLDEFLLEARERADEVESVLLELATSDPASRAESLARAKRELHTLKGNSGMMGFSDLQELAHSMEDQVELLDLEAPRIDELLSALDALRRGLEQARSLSASFVDPDAAKAAEPAAPEEDDAAPAEAEAVAGSVRVPFSRIDELVEIQAETLIFRNRLSDAIRRGKVLTKLGDVDSAERLERTSEAWENVELAQQALEKTLNRLQELVTNLGMVPLQALFRSLRRVVHDESSRAGKRVELETAGGETPIDKTLLEAAGEALGHLVRNAVIHGIEPPEKRRAAGKRETGTIRLAAAIEGGEVRIEVADDGAGVDVEALRRRARELGVGHVEASSDLALLFEEGLSTHEDADLSAGRGVGLGAVKKAAERHGGRVGVSSKRDRGTSFELRLPVTASILRSLLVRVDGEEYALPMSAVIESMRLDADARHDLNGAAVTRWRGRVVPLLDLGLAFDTASRPRSEGFQIVIEVNGRFRGLAVDSIVGIRDIVVKSLDGIVGQTPGISGSTILGDGRVIMILEPASLIAMPPFVEAHR